MAFNIQDFRAKVRDLARQYLWEVEVVFPTVIGKSDLVNVLAESTGTPKRTFTKAAANFMGAPHGYAGGFTYEAWPCTFRIDDNWDAYKRFRAWNELVVGTQSNIASFPSQYKSNVNLYELDIAGNRLNSFTLNGAWIGKIEGIAMDYSQHEVLTCTITFEFDYFVFTVL